MLHPPSLGFLEKKRRRQRLEPGDFIRQRIAALFDDDVPQSTLAHVVNILPAVLILVNVAAVILESVEQLRRILGGIISVVGIGTLALFSGLITVSYLNQLRVRREQHHAAPIKRLSERPSCA